MGRERMLRGMKSSRIGYWAMGYRVIGIALLGVIPARAHAQDAPPSDTSRLYINPTGRMLAPGQGYVAFDGLFLGTLEVGVTKQFSMGAGTILVPFVDAHPVWLTPKVQLYGSDRTNVAAGVIHTIVPGEARVGLAYSVATMGRVEASTTVGVGVLYLDDVDDRRGPAATPIALIGGERRFKPRVSFITDNSIGAHGAFLTAGFRWRLTDWQINLGGGVSVAYDLVLPGLWFSFARKFGGK